MESGEIHTYLERERGMIGLEESASRRKSGEIDKGKRTHNSL